MEELKNSIKKTGLIQPIIVKLVGNNHYEAIAGTRRLFAFQELKIENIPVIIIEANSEITENDIALIENLVREDLSPIEEAQAYMNRWELMKKDSTLDLKSNDLHKEISNALGIPYSRVYVVVSLLKLPEPIQNAIHLGKFKKTYGYELSRLSDHDQIMEWYKKITNKGHKNGWTLEKLKEEINTTLKEVEEKTSHIKQIKIKTLQNLKNNLKEKRNVRDAHSSDFTFENCLVSLIFVYFLFIFLDII